MDTRTVGIVGVHAVGASLFAIVAIRSVVLGDVVNAVMLGVLAALILILGVAIARMY